MIEEYSKTFCSMAFNHQMIQPSGTIKPCCRFRTDNSQMLGIANINTTTLHESFNSDKMNEIRRKMLIGEHVEGCTRCYQEEAAGKKSLRQIYNNTDWMTPDLIDINDPNIKWIELAISNDCNLMCQFCTSVFSHRLYDEEIEIYGKAYSSTKKTKIDIEKIFPHLDDIVHFKITGGEPLLTPDYLKLVDKIIEKDLAHKIFLNHSTNVTITPKKSLIDKWSKFKRVEFALSVDTIDKNEWEYIRYPSNHEIMLKTCNTFVDMFKEYNNVLISNRPTISIFNVWTLPETMDFWYNLTEEYIHLNVTHLSNPSWYSITVLPTLYKEKLQKKFLKFLENTTHYYNKKEHWINYVLNYMWSKDDSHLLDKLEYDIRSRDSHRNRIFEDYYPWLDGIFEKNE